MIIFFVNAADVASGGAQAEFLSPFADLSSGIIGAAPAVASTAHLRTLIGVGR